jgi:periplasmic divalent cation tolerance protein
VLQSGADEADSVIDAPGRYAIVLCTVGPADSADTIARTLVERRLAACVNIVGEVVSTYRWNGKLEREAERLLVIKTSRELFGRLRDTIRELHPYDVPEILLLPILDGDPPYLGWLAGELDAG